VIELPVRRQPLTSAGPGKGPEFLTDRKARVALAPPTSTRSAGRSPACRRAEEIFTDYTRMLARPAAPTTSAASLARISPEALAR
jgi:hypothetical protein